ncbi:MAG TPA: TonB-dependent receptor [Acidisarcina sp.]|nr:TonB-dependent receptor [Acidisarcina sp.]
MQGTVTDTQGAVVPGATLSLVDKETNRTLNATSGTGGEFIFNQLAPSSYKLSVSHAGFKTMVQDNVQIIAEQANALNVQLEVGGATETVTVNAADKPMIDTETGQISGTISQEGISKLPSYGRDVFQLVQLAPGVFGDGAQGKGGGTSQQPGNQGPGGSGASGGVFATENRPQVSGNGGRTDQNNITLDGVSINSVTWAGAAVVTPSEDSIKEMKVIANGYDAQYGRTGATQIQAISQNGTNQFHGTAFFKFDRPGLNAFQRYSPDNNPVRNTSRFNQIGGTVGGPIWRDHIFAFFSYETIRNSSTSTGDGWYDTAGFDKLGPSGSTSAKYLTLKGAGASYSKILEGPGDKHTCADVGLVQGLTCNFIAGAGLDLGRPLTGVPLGKHDPSFVSSSQPGLGGDGTGSPANFDGIADLFFVATVSPFSQTSQQFNGRLDFQVTSNDLVAFSIYYVPQDTHNFNGPSRPSNFFNHSQTNNATTVLWNHTFGPTLLNEVRVDAAGWRWNEIASNPQTPYGLPVSKLQTFSGARTLGSIDPNTISQFGPNVGSVFDQWTYSLKDTVTKVISSHSLKFGGEGIKLQYLDEPTWEAQPTYYFNNLWDFINDAPASESATVDPRTGIPSTFRKDTRQTLADFFVQDDWKVKPNLTVNLGLRWEYFGGLTEKKGNLSNLRLGSGSSILSGIAFKLGGNQVDAPKGNFGPQIGFAWSPGSLNNKLVVRGGFGMGYTGLEAAILTNTRFNPPFITSSGLLTGSQIVYGTASNLYQLGALPANPNLITTFDSSNLPTASGVSLNVTGIPRNLPTTYNYRYSLQTQYDVGHQWVATLGYQGSLGRHLPLQVNLNAVYAGNVLAGQVMYNPRLNYIDWYENTGASNFNALMAEMHHQFAHTYEVDAQYRWSKSMDDGSGPFTISDYSFLPGYNYGPSDYDVRNMFKLWGLWSPVIFRGSHSWMEKVLGGWTLSGILNWHSGFPWNPKYLGLACNAVIPNSGNCDLRPAKYLGGAGTSQGTDTFKKSNGNFPKSTSASGADNVYFTKLPVVQNNSSWPLPNGNAPTPTALPFLPGIQRNSFNGPRYFDIDATGTKAFGLPRMPVLGESARFEIRANAYNLFNQLNLLTPDPGITNAHFGRATTVLGSRTIELEAHFKF